MKITKNIVNVISDKQKKIKYKLKKIYNFLSNKEIDFCYEEISEIINHFNKNNKKKKQKNLRKNSNGYLLRRQCL